MDLLAPSTGNLSANGIVLLVMGLAGSGKSTFISQVTGQDVGVGHGLQSCTQRLSFHCVELNGKLVYLVDTPGFNDTSRHDVGILQELAFFLARTYERGVPFGGIICLHRISDNRMSGSAVKNFALLQKICGRRAASRVVLATCLWDNVQVTKEDMQAALEREKELARTRKFFGALLEDGSSMTRWTGDQNSALDIVQDLVAAHAEEGPASLPLQRELVDEKKELYQTSAGRFMLENFTKLAQKSRQELQELRRVHAAAIQDSQLSLAEQALAQRSRLQNRLEEIEDAETAMHVRVEHIEQEQAAAFRRLLSSVQSDSAAHVTQLEQDRRRWDTLQRVKRRDQEAFQHEQERHARHAAYLARTGQGAAQQNQREDMEATEEQYLQEQAENDARIEKVSQSIKKGEKRRKFKKNIVPLLTLLGDVGAIAGGAATGLAPLVATVIGLTGMGYGRLNFSSKPRPDTTSEATSALLPLADLAGPQSTAAS